MNYCVLWLFVVIFFCRQATFPLSRLYSISSVKGFLLAERDALDCVLKNQEKPLGTSCAAEVRIRKRKGKGTRVEISFRGRGKVEIDSTKKTNH